MVLVISRLGLAGQLIVRVIKLVKEDDGEVERGINLFRPIAMDL